MYKWFLYKVKVAPPLTELPVCVCPARLYACVCVSAGGRFSSGDRRHIPVRVCQQKRKASFRLPFLFLV